MNPELIRIIDQIEREKGVKKEVLIEAIETAVASASKKHLDPEDDVIVRLDRESGEISWLSPKRVVEELANAQREIGINEAIQIDPNIQIGEILPMPLEAEEFGRIAAQTAKQIIFQKLREAERERIYQDFKRTLLPSPPGRHPSPFEYR